jgi:hypothetical protein
VCSCAWVNCWKDPTSEQSGPKPEVSPGLATFADSSVPVGTGTVGMRRPRCVAVRVAHDVALAVKQNARGCGREPAWRLLLAGYSGPAPTVAAWANNFGTGTSPYDAFLVGSGSGEVATLSRADQSIKTIAPPSQRPVLRVDTETEVVETLGALRESDTPRLRSWELAGSSHIDATVAARFSELWGRDLGLPHAASICANPINPLVSATQ